MSLSSAHGYPRLRPVDARPISHGGMPAYLLRDPLRLAEHGVVIAQQLAPALLLCDGATHRGAMRAELRARYGLQVDEEVLDELLAALDEALLLDNERFAAARGAVVTAYRAAPYRPAALADQAYPADPAELRALLDGYLASAAPDVTPAASGRGVFSPHIDYQRGGHIYARVWQRAAELARQAELVVLLGTDHYGPEPITLTRQSYATPYGLLPTDHAAVDELAAALGEEAAFAGELFHRGEHAIELVAVWLHHMRGGVPVPLVPILTGSFVRFTQGRASAADDAALEGLVAAIGRISAGRRTLIVASGDLSHVGPAFGGRALGAAAKARLHAEDQGVIARLCAGDAAGLLAEVASIADQNNVCGLPPGYLALRTLGSARGELLGYDHCPADEQDTSVVSVAGVVWE
jgi:AmmeMemoRadiSam system protein B